MLLSNLVYRLDTWYYPPFVEELVSRVCGLAVGCLAQGVTSLLVMQSLECSLNLAFVIEVHVGVLFTF